MTSLPVTENPKPTAASPQTGATTPFGCPRDFHGNRFVYTVFSPRARGLSIGVNMNPDQRCNFDCAYCEVDRSGPGRESRLDLELMARELEDTIQCVISGRIRERPCYRNLSAELLLLRHVTLSGEGEPTLCPVFVDAVKTVVHSRARGRVPFFKLVLVTNASGLATPAVEEGLRLFTAHDEIWAKLDGGTQAWMDRVNKPKPGCAIETILANILALARQRPVVIQSLFPSINDIDPPPEEIEAYVQRLKTLREAGASISLVQIYSATRPTAYSGSRHLPLRSLSRIAQRVRDAAGLHAEVF